MSQVPSPRRPTASRMALELGGCGEMFQTQTRVRDSSSPHGVLADFSSFLSRVSLQDVLLKAVLPMALVSG